VVRLAVPESTVGGAPAVAQTGDRIAGPTR
jgi:hypothetical protein